MRAAIKAEQTPHVRDFSPDIAVIWAMLVRAKSAVRLAGRPPSSPSKMTVSNEACG
jgi:hypothetical protein